MKRWTLILEGGLAIVMISVLISCQELPSESERENDFAEIKSMEILQEDSEEFPKNQTPLSNTRVVIPPNPECLPGEQQHSGITLKDFGEQCLVMKMQDSAACRASNGYASCVTWPNAGPVCNDGLWRLPNKEEAVWIWEQRGTGGPVSSNGICAADTGDCLPIPDVFPHGYWTSTTSGNLAGFMDRGDFNYDNPETGRSVRCVKIVAVDPMLPVFEEDAKLTALDGSSSDYFGRAVALSGDGHLLVVGAYGDDDHGSAAGAAYLFHWSGSQWVSGQKLLHSGGTGEYAGYSVAISKESNVIVVGAHYAFNPQGKRSGAVYVYEKVAGQWEEVQKVTPNDGLNYDYFGRSVTLSGDGRVLAVGAPGETTTVTKAGAIYIYTRNEEGQWEDEVKFTPHTPVAYGNFGESVSLNDIGDILAVGAPNTDLGEGPKSGGVETFSVNSIGWNHTREIILDPVGAVNFFGQSVALSGNGQFLVVGSPQTGDDGGGPGTTYVFSRNGLDWDHIDTISAPNAQVDAYFGYSLDVSQDGSVIAVSAYLQDNRTGIGYQFIENQGVWEIIDYDFQASDGNPYDYLGKSTALDAQGQVMVMGAYGDDDMGSSSGSAYIFGIPSPDTIPPDPVSDVRFYSRGQSIDVFWTSSGDDGQLGVVAQYDIRYSQTSLGNDQQCDNAISYSESPFPQSPGMLEHVQIPLPGEQGNTFHVCIRAIDDYGNQSTWSHASLQSTDFSYGVKVLPFATRLPYKAGFAYQVLQGYEGMFSHQGCEQYALDFGMPEGTPLYAIANGKILYFKEDSNTNCNQTTPECYAQANRIEIDHGHGYISYYFHLMQNGVSVELAENVEAGQLLGFSGNTGYSTEPHLHFHMSSLDTSCAVPYPFSEDGLMEVLGVPPQNDEGAPPEQWPVSENDGTAPPNNYVMSTLPVNAFNNSFISNGIVLDPEQVPLFLEGNVSLNFTGHLTEETFNLGETTIIGFLKPPEEDDVISPQTAVADPTPSFNLLYYFFPVPGAYRFAMDAATSTEPDSTEKGYRIVILP